LTLRLAEQGYGTLYTGGGAEYDVSIPLFQDFIPVMSTLNCDFVPCVSAHTQNKRDLIEKKIELAKKKKQGIWKNGSTFETPPEYKKRVKNGGAVAAKAY
jgi:hypothetical protein